MRHSGGSTTRVLVTWCLIFLICVMSRNPSLNEVYSYLDYGGVIRPHLKIDLTPCSVSLINLVRRRKLNVCVGPNLDD